MPLSPRACWHARSDNHLHICASQSHEIRGSILSLPSSPSVSAPRSFLPSFLWLLPLDFNPASSPSADRDHLFSPGTKEADADEAAIIPETPIFPHPSLSLPPSSLSVALGIITACYHRRILKRKMLPGGRAAALRLRGISSKRHERRRLT